MFGLGNLDDVNQDCYKWCWSEAGKKNKVHGDMCSIVYGCPQCVNLCPLTAAASYKACSSKCSNDTSCLQNCAFASKKLEAKWAPPASADHFYKVEGKTPFWVPNPVPGSLINTPGSGSKLKPQLISSTAFTRVLPSGPSQPESPPQASGSRTWIYVAAAVAVVAAVGIGFAARKKAVPNRRKRRRR